MKITTAQLADSFWQSVEHKTDKEIEDIVKAFVKLLHRRNLISKKRAIIETIEDKRDERESHKNAAVTSVHQLSAAEQKSIEALIKELYSVKHVTLSTDTDGRLLGGVEIRVGWDRIVNTLKNRIDILKNTL